MRAYYIIICIMDEEKRYPIIEEEDGSCMKAGETEYEAVVQSETSLCSDDERVFYDVAPGTFGFYTNNAEEFQHHITEMEAEINDPNAEWIPSEQMWSEIKQEFSWLR